jgi:hypothetical protein
VVFWVVVLCNVWWLHTNILEDYAASILMMKAAPSSETLVPNHHATCTVTQKTTIRALLRLDVIVVSQFDNIILLSEDMISDQFCYGNGCVVLRRVTRGKQQGYCQTHQRLLCSSNYRILLSRIQCVSFNSLHMRVRAHTHSFIVT